MEERHGVTGPEFREGFDRGAKDSSWLSRTSAFEPGFEREQYQMAFWLQKFLLEKSMVFLSL